MTCTYYSLIFASSSKYTVLFSSFLTSHAHTIPMSLFDHFGLCLAISLALWMRNTNLDMWSHLDTLLLLTQELGLSDQIWKESPQLRPAYPRYIVHFDLGDYMVLNASFKNRPSCEGLAETTLPHGVGHDTRSTPGLSRWKPSPSSALHSSNILWHKRFPQFPLPSPSWPSWA